MPRRPRLPPQTELDLVTASRRRCCLCFGLSRDDAEKRGQAAHLDHDPTNNDPDNLAFLCLDHHDEYDSQTSQSKGLTMREVKLYRAELLAHVARHHPPADQEIVATLMLALDRPAFRTPFHAESSLPRFREAIAEAIETLNTGKTPQGVVVSSKAQVRDQGLRATVEQVVESLVSLRASFDALVRSREIRPCGCSNPDCHTFMFSSRACHEMDTRRARLLHLAHALNPALPSRFYDLG